MAAAASAHEACSSISRCTYHVFLSFRGQDTRKNFTDHLYTALVRAGIHTFLDDDGIERGENIQAELEKAIKESRISIIVFSKDYASSRWCLDELVMIMERKKTVGLIVLPVFYDVDPSQVRKQTESFNDSFGRHEIRFKEEIDKVERWRAALSEVADLGGMVLDNGHESQFVQNIVKEIGSKLNRKILNVAPYLVGIVSRVEDINLWVQDGSNDVGIAMIYGIGGIGKTTIAKTIYNMNFDRFQATSFLGNVRETTQQLDGLVRLQRQLISDIFKGKTSKIYNADEGIIKIKNAVCCRRVFLVLDDVDQLDQLNAIIGMREWFYRGSKIIITTRYEQLLRSHEVCEKFEVKQMDDDESLQLFSWHSFGQGYPIEGYMECSRSAVHHCGGLPLALQVLGSSLSGKCINVWESALQKLEAVPHSKIQKILKVSYDSLQDDHEKNLFLDIACFFIGKDKDYTIAILDGCDYYTTVGIQNLIDRCLLTVSEDEKLMMHQLLRDMGREVIRQESTDDPGKRSRLWRHRDAFTVLKEKMGTETVKGLTLDLRKLMKDKGGKTIITENYTKQHHDENSLDKDSFISWQPMSTASANSFPLSNEAGLETKTFVKMNKLKLLKLNYVKFSGAYEDFPKNLIWLCWHGFPLKSIPTNFHLEKLVALDMRFSSLECVWTGTRFLAELKFLDLSHSHCLVRTPDFSGLPSLERLMLEDCINLVEVGESIGNLDRLVLLDLSGCKKLRKLAREIGMLKSLLVLSLSGCSNLDELPKELRKMESSRILDADGIAINQLHASTSDTRQLSLLQTTPTNTPHSMSFSLSFLPHCLVNLSLANCNLSDDAISHSFDSLVSLVYLDLSGNPFHSLPESIKGLTMLNKLWLLDCRGLQSVPEFPKSLKKVTFFGSTSLERVSNITILSSFLDLAIVNSEKLVEIEGVFKLEPLENADVTILKSLGLSNLESLRSIEVDLKSYIISDRRTPLQVLHECDVLSIFLPGSRIPYCFTLRNMGSSISFYVPPFVGHKICGLNLCVVYEYGKYVSSLCYDCAIISNKAKRMRWTYSPIFYAKARKEDMLWLSHWKIGDQLEGGDRIDVSVVFCHQVKMCGVCLVYEPEDQTIEEIVRSPFPWYQTVTLGKPGAAYFRCHHSFSLHKYFVDKEKYRHNTYMMEQNPQLELDTCFLCEKFDRDFGPLPGDFIDYCYPMSPFYAVYEENPQLELDTCFLCEKFDRDIGPLPGDFIDYCYPMSPFYVVYEENPQLQLDKHLKKFLILFLFLIFFKLLVFRRFFSFDYQRSWW